MIFWVGAYRALRAVLYIIDRKLDLSLLSDQRVLKEGYTAQEDRVTGALKTETDRQRWDRCGVSNRSQEAKASEQWRTSMISVWACLVQKACGGVVQLTATKLVGLRSREGVTSSLQAAATGGDYKLWDLMVGWSLILGHGRNVMQYFWVVSAW